MLNKVLPEPGLQSIAYGERAGLNQTQFGRAREQESGFIWGKNDANWLTNQRFSPGMPTWSINLENNGPLSNGNLKLKSVYRITKTE